MATLHPPGFVETGECSGPRYTRSQPNRESAGVLLTDQRAVDNKYVSEFSLPRNNVLRYAQEMKMNWDKMTEQQKQQILYVFPETSNLVNPTTPGQNSTSPTVARNARRIRAEAARQRNKAVEGFENKPATEGFSSSACAESLVGNSRLLTLQNTKLFLNNLKSPTNFGLDNSSDEKNLKDGLQSWLNEGRIDFYLNVQPVLFMVIIAFLAGFATHLCIGKHRTSTKTAP